MTNNQAPTPSFRIERKMMKDSTEALGFVHDFQEIVNDHDRDARVTLVRPRLTLVTARTAAILSRMYPTFNDATVGDSLDRRVDERIGTTGDFLRDAGLGDIEFVQKDLSKDETIVRIGIVGVAGKIESDRAALSTVFTEIANNRVELPSFDLTIDLAKIVGADQSAFTDIKDYILNFAPPTVDLYDARVRTEKFHGELPDLQEIVASS